MTIKLNSMRLLDSRGIRYVAQTYDESGAFHSAEEAAQLVGAPVHSVYKTLLVLRDPPGKGKPLLVMVAAEAQLDLTMLAKSLGERRLRMATLHEAEMLTGLQVGGISALALLNRGFEICLDCTALQLQEIHIRAGQRGVDLLLAVEDLVHVTGAKVVAAAGGPTD